MRTVLIEKFNEECAECLSFKKLVGQDCFYVPFELHTSITNGIMPARKMKFDRDWNWSHLLVKFVKDAGFEIRKTEYATGKYNWVDVNGDIAVFENAVETRIFKDGEHIGHYSMEFDTPYETSYVMKEFIREYINVPS